MRLASRGDIVVCRRVRHYYRPVCMQMTCTSVPAAMQRPEINPHFASKTCVTVNIPCLLLLAGRSRYFRPCYDATPIFASLPPIQIRKILSSNACYAPKANMRRKAHNLHTLRLAQGDPGRSAWHRQGFSSRRRPSHAVIAGVWGALYRAPAAFHKLLKYS
jgi:hypothetical protein